MVRKAIDLLNVHSNNEAKYATLTMGLEVCVELGIQKLIIKGDLLHTN